MTFLRRCGFQVAGALAAVGVLVAGIFTSTSSTAPIGFLLVPVAAAGGAFVADAVKYVWGVLSGWRHHSVARSAVILVALILCAYWFVQMQRHARDMALAQSPSASHLELLSLLEKSDAEITHAVAANPALDASTLDQVVDGNLRDYYIMSGAVRNPKLSIRAMERVGALVRGDFAGDAEYRLYQTFAWAPLVRRGDVPGTLVHALAAKESPEHFLVLALLDVPSISCGEMRRFLPQDNEVLDSAVRRAIKRQNCPQ